MLGPTRQLTLIWQATTARLYAHRAARDGRMLQAAVCGLRRQLPSLPSSMRFVQVRLHDASCSSERTRFHLGESRMPAPACSMAFRDSSALSFRVRDAPEAAAEGVADEAAAHGVHGVQRREGAARVPPLVGHRRELVQLRGAHGPARAVAAGPRGDAGTCNVVRSEVSNVVFGAEDDNRSAPQQVTRFLPTWRSLATTFGFQGKHSFHASIRHLLRGSSRAAALPVGRVPGGVSASAGWPGARLASGCWATVDAHLCAVSRDGHHTRCKMLPMVRRTTTLSVG